LDVLAAGVRFVRLRESKRLWKEVLLAVIGLGILYMLFLWVTLPDITDPHNLTAAQSSVIVDRKGVELYRLYRDEDRIFVPGEQIPQDLKDAVVAIEDARFYDRGCLDVRAIARAVFSLGHGGGASTLTRQLARNALDLKQENIINRKAKELILGCQLEHRYSKQDLLNLYLNWIPFGKNAYGVALASKTYFNTDAKDLTLAQSAVLAALPQAPTYYSPYGKHVRTTVSDSAYKKILAGKITSASQLRDSDVVIGLLGNFVGTGATTFYVGGRTDQVLRNMQDLGYIKEADRLSAQKELETITFHQSREDIRAPHFVLWVKDQVQQLLAGGAEDGILDQGGLTIETTLDWDMQQAAEKAIVAKKDAIAKVYSAHNIALVSVEAGTNRILAYVGNTDYNDETSAGKVDMARAPRQPGSSFKPLVYGAAFEKGYSPSTVLYDVQTKIGTDTPQDFDGTFWGAVNIRRALAGSRNIPAAKAFFLAGGESTVLEFASRLGATAPSDQKKKLSGTGAGFAYGWPLALGAGETPLVQMVQAYATYAAGGVYQPVTSILRIKDRRGNILYDASQQPQGSQVVDPRVAYMITSILSDVSARPNAYWQQILTVPGFQAAAKTGTSNKCMERGDSGDCKDRKPSDLWTMGYTPDIVTGIWVGNADSKPLAEKAEALTIASPIWQDYMIRAHKLLKDPKVNFDVPQGIVQAQISTLSGELPTECTPVDDRKSDVFLQEHAPTLQDPACVQLLVDKVTGLLASDSCPAQAAQLQSFFDPKGVAAENGPHPWQSTLPTSGTGSFPLPLAPTQKCDPSLTPGRFEKPTVHILTPQSGERLSYPAFKSSIQIDAKAAITHVQYFVDDKPLRSIDASPTAPLPNLSTPLEESIRVPRSIERSGTHRLKVTVTDQYFNETQDEVSFSFE
jgi:membrane peptidoglycan carboxypeptidase